jgi:hypothetical protein
MKNTKEYEERLNHFVLALVLTVTAPTDEQSEEAKKIAFSLGSQILKEDQEICKKSAECAIAYIKKYG